MAIWGTTGTSDEDDYEGAVDGERDEPGPYDDEDAPFAEEEARENAGEVLQDDELPLADEEARLPWLEGDEDEEDYGGYSTGQTVFLVLAGLLVLALIGGGIWWLARGGPDADLVADGRTIDSEGPYKQRPDDPGGKVFEGTGDSSFKVSEGQTSPARLGQEGPQAAPGFQTLERDRQDAAPAAAPTAAAPVEAVGTAGVGVQVGAYSDRAAAEAGWSKLSQQYEALQGVRHRIVQGRADFGTVYRLQAIAEDASAAGALCRDLKASGLNCYVKP